MDPSHRTYPAYRSNIGFQHGTLAGSKSHVMPPLTASSYETTSKELWQSDRLVYRSIDDGDEAFLASLEQDAQSFVNYSRCLPLPRGKKSTKLFIEYLESRLLAAIVCLAPDATGDSERAMSTAVSNTQAEVSVSDLIPIGVIHLGETNPAFVQHRSAELGIMIRKEHRNQQFGTEAIRWALNWAFRYGGLHRIELFAYSYNEPAIRLYKRVGFKLEGCRRDAQFVNGKFWDIVLLGILEDEWQGTLDMRPTRSTGEYSTDKR